MLEHKSLTQTIKKKPHVSKNLCIIGNTILSKSDFMYLPIHYGVTYNMKGFMG